MLLLAMQKILTHTEPRTLADCCGHTMLAPYTKRVCVSACVCVCVCVCACGKSGNSAVKVTVRPDYCRDVLIERF